MINSLAQLQKVYAASQNKQQQFAKQTCFQLLEYRGSMELSANSDLRDALQFHPPFNPEHGSTTIHPVALPKTTALATFQQRYGAAFANAINIVVY